ncbi:MAG: hypothetical protein ABIW76_23205 [Fibrobacteria bacterium]
MKPLFPKNRLPKRVAAMAVLFAMSAALAQPDGIDKNKLIIKGFVDFGHLVNGYNYYAPDDLGKDISWLPLNRANVLVIQEYSAGKFDAAFGLSGLIWWPYGQGKSANISERVMQVKPMVPVARARWKFGEPTGTEASLQVGTFSYKYNPDAKNLGEYLYRSGTYPGMLVTGEGWLLMNRAGNYSHGALLSMSHLGGMFKHNVSLFMETVYYPVGDFSPGYDATFTSKWFEIGGGAVLNHGIAFRPSNLAPKDPTNTYLEIRGKTANGADTVVKGRADKITPPAVPSDTNVTYWTIKGIKLMGRAALNLGHVLPEAIRGPEDLRFFIEAALLGVKDYPLFYEKKSERIPIMAGVNLPTFKLLDVFSVQGEIYKSPYSDGTKFVREGLPTWQTGTVDSSKSTADDFKWSIYAKKSVNKAFTVYAQAASDHFRLTDAAFSTSNIPLTNTWNHDWYYLFRLEFNLR